MVLRADPSRLLVSEVATTVARDAAILAKTFRGPGAFARGDQLVRATLSIVSKRRKRSRNSVSSTRL